jgi:restriction endonuclease S subunit
MSNTVKVGDICKLNYGKALDRKDRLENGVVSVYGANGIKTHTDKFLHDKPSIIIGRKGSAGELKKVAEPFWALDVTYFVTIDESIVDLDFLFYSLITLNLPSMARGVKPGINRNDVYDKSINLPSLSQQQRIVAKLDATFAEIDKAVEKAQAKEFEIQKLKASLLSSSFSENGKIWKKFKLADVCTLRNGRAYKKPELLAEGKYRVLRVGNFFTNKNWYYSDLELDDKKYCDKGDLLYAWSASFGPRLWEAEKVIYHYHIWRVDINDEIIDKRFLFYWFEFDKESIKSASGTGTTMMHVSKSSMEKREIYLPPLTEQQHIVAKLDTIFNELADANEAIEQSKVNYHALKSAILAQELQSIEAA